MLSANQATLFTTLNDLACELGFSRYSELAALIYPTPKYRTFHLKKKSGGTRTIHAPRKLLKDLQWKVLALLDPKCPPPKPAVHGFTRNKSVLTNAQEHLGKTFVFNVDLKDFFPTIHFGRVKGLLQAKPFGYLPETAAVIAHICCKDGVLPQGAPTSPLISNLICRRLDNELQELAKENRATYTRYCDDITFSFTVKKPSFLPADIVRIEGGKVHAGEKLASIIERNSFHINEEKVSLHDRAERMRVTGITVNEQPNVPREFVHGIRGMLHAWERYGLDAAEGALANRYARQLRRGIVPPFHKVLRGKLLYLKMIRGEASPVYARLARRFNEIAARDKLDPDLKLRISRRATNRQDAERATFSVDCCQDFDVHGCLTSSGTAFLFENDILVTCWHVIAPFVKEANAEVHFAQEAIELRDFRRKKGLLVTIVASCKHRDIALLKPLFDASDYPYLSAADLAPNAGSKAVMLGYPNGWVTKGISVTNTEVTTEQYPKSGVGYIEVRDQIRAGSSGGPVLDQTWKLLGIAREGATQNSGDNGVVIVQELTALLGEANLQKPSSPSVQLQL